MAVMAFNMWSDVLLKVGDLFDYENEKSIRERLSKILWKTALPIQYTYSPNLRKT